MEVARNRGTFPVAGGSRVFRQGSAGRARGSAGHSLVNAAGCRDSELVRGSELRAECSARRAVQVRNSWTQAPDAAGPLSVHAADDAVRRNALNTGMAIEPLVVV